MCISCEMDDKWPPLIEFVIWFTLMGLNVGNHYGVWIVSKSHVIDVSDVLPVAYNVTKCITESITTTAVMSTINTTANVNVNQVTVASTAPTVSTAGGFSLINSTMNTLTMTNINKQLCDGILVNVTEHYNKTVEEQWKSLSDFRNLFLIFCCVGAGFFLIHVCVLLPNIIQSFRVPDPQALKDSDNVYFSNLLKIHSIFLILESICFDIPIGCLVMEILSLIWEGPLSHEQNMAASKLIIALSLIGLAFIALYKGMMPLFLWIGNPFCFPCIPLRLLIVFPGGLITLVMTFGPAMGVAKNRLLQFAPDVMQAEMGDMANTFFSIGMIFWGVFGVVVAFTACCWYKFCREGADADICNACC